MKAVEPDDVAEARIRERTTAEKFVAPPDVALILRLLDDARTARDAGCEFEHPHPDHPHGKRVPPTLNNCMSCELRDGSTHDPNCTR